MAGRHGDLVSIDVYTDFIYDFPRIEVDEECGVLALIGDKKKTL
jgi:hypothetical protein